MPEDVKTTRILACVLCQQRKVKCNRVFPCATCLKSGIQCVPANALPLKPRRRRFAERELLDRIRRYEQLMTDGGINYEPLHPGTSKAADYNNNKSAPAALSSQAIDLWSALSRATLDDDDEGSDIDDAEYSRSTSTADESVIQQSYTERFRSNGIDHMQDHLLFGPVLVDSLVSFHPEDPSSMFKLWQIYLDNVNPLLKITNTATLQPRVIDAISKLDSIDPSLELLLFGIYSVAVFSLDDEQCQSMFHASRDALMLRFQSAAQQALHRCSLWKSSSHDALTGFFLFMISLRTQCDARSLSCMLAVALRMAQRNGLHIEASLADLPPLHAELRRRFWWALVIYDGRICELCNHASSMMTPLWDCALPHNLGDFELRPDLKVLPEPGDRPTEALFVVLRARLADFARHSSSHLSFTNPSLSAIAKGRYSGEIDTLEKELEMMLAKCDLNDGLSCMTFWTIKSAVAKLRLLQHYSLTSSSKPNDQDRAAAMSYAIAMLQSDTRIRQSRLTKGFLWHAEFHFPALAYHHILNNCCKRPGTHLIVESWQAMNDNFETFSSKMTGIPRRGVAHFFTNTAELITKAWKVREEYLTRHGLPAEAVPHIVWMAQAETTTVNDAHTVMTDDTALDQLEDIDWSLIDQQLMLDALPESH